MMDTFEIALSPFRIFSSFAGERQMENYVSAACTSSRAAPRALLGNGTKVESFINIFQNQPLTVSCEKKGGSRSILYVLGRVTKESSHEKATSIG